MPTNRELFFKYQKEGIPDRVIYFSLEECNGFNHVLLTQNFDNNIKDEKRFVEAMNRYQNGEMIEYIFNKTYFLSRPFYVNKNVLIPRQETEQLVLNSAKLIKQYLKIDNPHIVDVCTGSGCVGISLAHIFSEGQVTMSDISFKALEVAKINTVQHGLYNVSIIQGDMLEPFIQRKIKADVIICNPPYIEKEEEIDKKTWEQEPHLALLAKPGTIFFEKVFQRCLGILNQKYLLCFEIGEDLVTALTKLVEQYFPHNSFYFENDIYNRPRFLYIKGEK